MGNSVRKFREKGKGFFDLREVTGSKNDEGIGIGNLITVFGFWKPRQLSSLGFMVLG